MEIGDTRLNIGLAAKYEEWFGELLGAASRDMVLEAQCQGSEYGHDNYTVPIEDLDPVPCAEEVVQVG